MNSISWVSLSVMSLNFVPGRQLDRLSGLQIADSISLRSHEHMPFPLLDTQQTLLLCDSLSYFSSCYCNSRWRFFSRCIRSSKGRVRKWMLSSSSKHRSSQAFCLLSDLLPPFSSKAPFFLVVVLFLPWWVQFVYRLLSFPECLISTDKSQSG